MNTSRVGLPEIVAFARRYRILVLGCGLLGLALGILLSVKLPREYRADVIMVLVNDPTSSGSLSSMQSQLGGLASLVGLNIGGTMDQRAESLEFLKSRQLARDFIHAHQLAPELFEDRWDNVRKTWKADKPPPTDNDVVTYFSRNVRSVVDDKRSGMVTLSITLRDPARAAELATALVREANDAVRERAIAETGQRVKYLTDEAEKATVVGVREASSRLIESQLSRSMVARTATDFAYRVVDPASVPDKKDYVSPHKILLLIGGLVGGGFFGLVIAALWNIASQLWKEAR